jgi:hypothetical protein
MGKSDAAFDFDRYGKLLTEANDEPKRLALIDLLIEEKAKDRLAVYFLHARLADLELPAKSRADWPNQLKQLSLPPIGKV